MSCVWLKLVFRTTYTDGIVPLRGSYYNLWFQFISLVTLFGIILRVWKRFSKKYCLGWKIFSISSTCCVTSGIVLPWVEFLLRQWSQRLGKLVYHRFFTMWVYCGGSLGWSELPWHWWCGSYISQLWQRMVGSLLLRWFCFRLSCKPLLFFVFRYQWGDKLCERIVCGLTSLRFV